MITAIQTKHLTRDELIHRIEDGLAHESVQPFASHWYHHPTTWQLTRYRGVPMLKNALDLQVYHEMIYALKPRVILETGTCFGGSALWFADQLSLANGYDTPYRVISIDVENRRDHGLVMRDGWQPFDHERITWINGNSVDARIVAQVRALINCEPVMVCLDSDHSVPHVTAELNAYSDLVTPGHYCVVEDTNTDGPAAAVTRFLSRPEGAHFKRDPMCERYLLTMHPGGWLRRVR